MPPESYKFDEKNKWRKKIWSDISHVMEARERRDAIVLYLGGEEDLDRYEATCRGFGADNLIIVERDKRKAIHLRKKGKNVIQTDMFSVLNCWNSGPRIAVIVADLTSVVRPELAPWFLDLLTRSAFQNAIFVFNFQRGRETLINFFKDLCGIAEEMHRGKIFLRWLFGFDLRHVPRIPVLFYSYRSSAGSIHMDSVLFRNPLTSGPHYREDAADALRTAMLKRKEFILKGLEAFLAAGYDRDPNDVKLKIVMKERDNVPGKLAAALAIRTMRISGKLDHSPSF